MNPISFLFRRPLVVKTVLSHDGRELKRVERPIFWLLPALKALGSGALVVGALLLVPGAVADRTSDKADSLRKALMQTQSDSGLVASLQTAFSTYIRMLKTIHSSVTGEKGDPYLVSERDFNQAAEHASRVKYGMKYPMCSVNRSMDAPKES